MNRRQMYPNNIVLLYIFIFLTYCIRCTNGQFTLFQCLEKSHVPRAENELTFTFVSDKDIPISSKLKVTGLVGTLTADNPSISLGSDSSPVFGTTAKWTKVTGEVEVTLAEKWGKGTPYRFMITLKNGPNKSAGVTPTVELLSDGTSSRTSQDKVLVVNAAFKRLTVFSTPTGDTKTKIDFTFEPTSNIQKEKTLIIKKLAGSKTADGPLQITNTCAKNFEDEKGQWIKEAGTLTLKISTEAGLSSDKECPISITLDLGEGAGTVKPTIQIGEDGTAQQFIGEVNLEKTETPASSSGPSGPAKVVTTAAPSSGPSGA
eukprot:g3869.t1